MADRAADALKVAANKNLEPKDDYRKGLLSSRTGPRDTSARELYIRRLALVYKEASGEAPKRNIHRISHKPDYAFFRFAEKCIEFVDPKVTESALDESIKRALAQLVHTKDWVN